MLGKKIKMPTRLNFLNLVNSENLEKNIQIFSEMSISAHGVTRLAFTELERQSHNHFAVHMKGLGLHVWTDSAGNTMAQYPAKCENTLPFLATGSHLDSVPEGGSYDGIVGVAAAMEIARILSEGNISLNRPWRFIVFAAEEGARFGQACNGSRAIAGLTTSAELENLLDSSGISLAEAMRKLGFNPTIIEESRWRHGECAAFIELHIEQGNVLESENFNIGIVNVISGSQRLLVTVKGIAAHSGGTPMSLRKDALLTAANGIVAIDGYARKIENAGVRVTVGRITALPGSITTIPGWVQFTVDIRDFEIARQVVVVEELSKILTQMGEANGTEVFIKPIGSTPPTLLSPLVTEKLKALSSSLGLEAAILPSGASHDCQQMTRVTEAGLIFITSKSGHSHMPEEFSSLEDIEMGVKLLFASLFELDCTVSLSNA